MSDTIADVKISMTEYTDLNLATGIAAGTALVISNKSNSPVLLQIATSQPSSTSLDGELLNPPPDSTSVKLVTAGENTVWARASKYSGATISIQENS